MQPSTSRPSPPLLLLALCAPACGPGSDESTTAQTSTETSAQTSSTTAITETTAQTSGPTTTDATTGVTTSGTTGGATWPPPFTPTPEVMIVLDPDIALGDGPCIYTCTPAVREELPPVMDLCELLGGNGLASGPCMGGACPGPTEVCMVDEFAFSDSYCALDGLPPAYCGGFPQADTGHVVVSTRITHRLVGAQLVLEFAPADDPTPVVSVFLQEGWDEVDDMGHPYPIPARLAPTGGTITLKEAGFTPGAVLSGTYALTFAWPDDPTVTRTLTGHFDHTL